MDSSVGPDTAAAVTDSTIVTGDGELAPGVQVEVTLESDGFTAKEVEIIEQEESSEAGTPAAAPTPTPEATETPTATATATPTDSEAAESTPEPPKEYILTGKIRSFSVEGITLDDVYLDLGSIATNDESFTIGEEVQFTVIVDESGQWIVVGVAE